MTVQPVDTAARRSRRRKSAPLDPRRSPGGLTPDPPPDASVDEPAARVTASGAIAPGIAPGIANGVAVLRAALRNVPASPGVYRMLDRKGDALYVGKARNLKSRVQNYTHPAGLSNRLRRMVAETAVLEIVVAATEAEALLLECNLIKRLMPRYNVLLRDDKSFPFIHLTADREFPRLTKFRGARDKSGSYFGPFASAGAVNRTLVALQKAFLLRSCSDSIFANRTRPCLLYQIKRCSAPCVGRIGGTEYAALIEQAHALPVGPQPRYPGAPRDRDGQGGRDTRFRGGGPDPRPHPRLVAGAGPPGHPCARDRRCRCDRGAPGGRPDLRPGVFLPRRP